MRSDYVLYGIAIIFFILTGAVLAIQTQQQLWIMTTAVLGLLFVGLGYSQKPRPRSISVTETVPTSMMNTSTSSLATAPPHPAPMQETEAVVEPIREPAPESVIEPGAIAPSPGDITQVKGVKTKRAEQLKALGVNSLQDLANASAEDLGKRLDISPKITAKWIEHAKQLVQKS